MGIVLADVVASCFCSLSFHLVFVALARAIRLNVIIIKLKLEAFQVVCGVVFVVFVFFTVFSFVGKIVAVVVIGA